LCGVLQLDRLTKTEQVVAENAAGSDPMSFLSALVSAWSFLRPPAVSAKEVP
jgi:hypothetical protein